MAESIAIERWVIDRLGMRDAVEAAAREARRSGLPGAAGGPQDAYRHLLITGELYRRLGPRWGRLAAERHESGNIRRGEQTAADTAMDEHNNAIVTRERPPLRTWADTVRWARTKMDAALPRNGDGANGTPMWYRKPAVPPARPNWEALGIPEIEGGGTDQNYDDSAQSDDPQQPGAALDRDPATWSPKDVDQVIGSPAYRQLGHPDRELAHAAVRTWFEHRYGEQEGGRPPSGPAADVQVRAHEREGGKVQVRSYSRSAPA